MMEQSSCNVVDHTLMPYPLYCERPSSIFTPFYFTLIPFCYAFEVIRYRKGPK